MPILETQTVFGQLQPQFDRLAEFVAAAAENQAPLDAAERSLAAMLLELGRAALQALFDAAGDGDRGETLPHEGTTLRRMSEQRVRTLRSIFGKLRVRRFVYAERDGQPLFAPLDARLGLPEHSYTALLEDWAGRLGVQQSFLEAGGTLRALLGVKLGVHALESISRRLGADAEAFAAEQAPPPAAAAAELVVVQADGKGVPMVRRERPAKSPGRAGRKRIACVGAAYGIKPFVRSADDVLDETHRRAAAQRRPCPQHKRVLAELTRVVDGVRCEGRVTTFGRLADQARDRAKAGAKIVCLCDGEPALRREQQAQLPEATLILEWFHAGQYACAAATALHPRDEGARAAETERLERLLLTGQVARAIRGLRRRASAPGTTAAVRRALRRTANYWSRRRDCMKYDEYLAAGLPIGSGVVEGACRHLVKDRLELAGMKWTTAGAQALLATRALHLNGDWPAFIAHRTAAEQSRLYARAA